MNQNEKKKVFVIFKGDDESLNQDEYYNELKSLGIEVFLIPVLSFSFMNLDVLETKLQEMDSFSGLILTSPRSVIAIKKAIKNEILLNRLNSTKFIFSIGPQTNFVLKSELNLSSLQPSFPIGCSENLVKFIIQFKDNLKHAPLLMPCSSLAKTNVQNALKLQNINIVRLDVYQTCSNPKVEENLKKILLSHSTNHLYFIYFSPSGVKTVDLVLEKLSLNKDTIKHIAIGPVTNQALVDRNFKVLAVSEQPQPICLKETIKKAINLQ